MKLIPCILLVAIVATTQAEPKVTLIDGSWNPGEGGAVTMRPNPLHRPFGVDFDSKGRMWIVELEGGRVHRLANGIRAHVGGDGSKSYRGDGGPLGQARRDCGALPPARPRPRFPAARPCQRTRPGFRESAPPPKSCRVSFRRCQIRWHGRGQAIGSTNSICRRSAGRRSPPGYPSGQVAPRLP